MKKHDRIEAVVVGAGARGQFAYASYENEHPDEITFIGVADTKPAMRERFAREHKYVKPEYIFSDWKDLVAAPKICDTALVCTPDNMHVDPAIALIEKGYKYIMMEKPIDKDMDKCQKLVEVAEKHGAKIQVCHSLRYARYYRKLKEVIDSGVIGKICHMDHIEEVGFYHQAHSFVRGNWGNSVKSSPMILQKCCHDMDIFLYLTGKTCKQVSSFGSLSYFNEANAPENSSDRCVSCDVRYECPYDATKIYNKGGHWYSPNIPEMEGFETIKEMLEKGRYGKCVFRCDNDVVDHQNVSLLMNDGMTISHTMTAFTAKMSRITRIMGSLGEIYANTNLNKIIVSDFLTGTETEISLTRPTGGHGGADILMVKEFVDMVNGAGDSVSDIALSVHSHQMAMAAEESRLGGGIIKL